MKKVTEVWSVLHNRWKAKTPLIFKRIAKIGMVISGTAITIQTTFVTSGINAPEWWTTICPGLITLGIGMAGVAKLTQQYDENGNPVNKEDK